MANLIKVEMENTYEYLGHRYDDFGQIGNLLNYNLHMAQDVSLYTTDVEAVLKEAQALAKQFVDESHPVNPYSNYQTTYNLRDSIKYDVTTLNGGSGGRLYADARDRKGHKYAGHIEYGFTDKMGIPHGPWPFLRPAIRLATEASTKNFAQTMGSIAMYGFDNKSPNLKIGGRNVGSQIQEWGGRASAARAIHQAYQGYGKGGSRWHKANNGIGFKSGVSYGNRANEDQFRWGSL